MKLLTLFLSLLFACNVSANDIELDCWDDLSKNVKKDSREAFSPELFFCSTYLRSLELCDKGETCSDRIKFQEKFNDFLTNPRMKSIHDYDGVNKYILKVNDSLNKNKEFYKSYLAIQEKNNAKEELIERKRENAKKIQQLKPDAKLGDSGDFVIEKTRWGRPYKVNTTITKSGTREQFVYGSGSYLYFENDVLVSIQKSTK